MAIDTSCDETALSLFDEHDYFTGKRVADCLVSEVVSSQVDLHAEYGGVVPELAAREHLVNFPHLLGALLKPINGDIEAISSVAVTRGPGLNGCLLVGLCFGKGLALGARIPLVLLNHIEGHLFGAMFSADFNAFEYPALALIVSGGHTLLVNVKGFRQYEIIAQTRDDAAGEAFDKCASLIGLGYPGGPKLSKLAQSGDATKYRLPIGLNKDNTSFSFSGLKTAVYRLVQDLDSEVENEQVKADVCASVENAIVVALIEKTKAGLNAVGAKQLFLCGGVAANATLRKELKNLAEEFSCRLIFPPIKYCTDNASMMGALALEILKQDKDGYESIRNMMRNGVYRGTKFREDAAGAKPRFPLTEVSN
ncbi:MAG: tRNA (adenosine(37)-N6)-threonylcarbamoyltransferase complex transferase subunit TsaD [Deltaproteobacteria bacterium]|nr:tRNA (adenosine(37)-N6)-threonylcarbamoyltransferase complex transferase subunit TsaD [Deltaproteobacteria bacterium]